MHEQSFPLPDASTKAVKDLDKDTTVFHSSPRVKIKLFMNSSHCASVSVATASSNLSDKEASFLLAASDAIFP